MSRTIDERVVELRFNNQQFEQNARTSIGTLEKLKQLLNFGKTEQALDNMSASARKFDMGGIANAVDNIHNKFTALEVVGITALANIANQAINTGKQMVNSLTIEPISDGFHEYELKMGSIQTIMMSTGESLETVNKYLDDLNTYADKTIYSFKDMTSNIGKFTNAGVGLDDAVKAIQGVSNVAAISGANTWDASRAMYNFAQALSSGAVKLIDWKSIENANMATVEFKQTLIDTALALGTVVETEEGYVSTTTDMAGKVSEAFTETKGFNDSLSHQWMTTNVLTTALQAYSHDIREMNEEERKAYHDKLIAIGYTDEQAERIEQLGSKAFDAAQEIKTFTQMMDTLKEAVGSGWARSFEIIFGDFEKAKKLWTTIGNFVSGIIDQQAEQRNAVLQAWADRVSVEDGGRGKLLRSFARIGRRIKEYVQPIRDAFEDLIPKPSIDWLGDLVWKFSELTKHMKWNAESYKNLGLVARGFFSTLKLLGTTALKVGQYGFPVLTAAAELVGRRFLELAGPIGGKLSDTIEGLLNTGSIDAFLKTVSDGLLTFIHKIDEAIEVFKQGGIMGLKDWIVDQFKDITLDDVLNGIQKKVEGFVNTVGKLFGKEKLYTSIQNIGTKGVSYIEKFKAKINEAITAFKTGGVKGLGGWIYDQFSAIDFSSILNAWHQKFKDLVNQIGLFFGKENLYDTISGFVSHWITGIKDKLTKAFDDLGLTGVLETWSEKFHQLISGIEQLFGIDLSQIGKFKFNGLEKLTSFFSILRSLFGNGGAGSIDSGEVSKQTEAINSTSSWFTAIGDFFQNNKIVSAIRSFVESSPLFEKFKETIELMKTSFSDLANMVSDFRNQAGDNLTSFSDAFASFIEYIGPKLDEIDWVGVAAFAGQITSMILAFKAISTFALAVKTTSEVVSTATNTMLAVKGFFGKINGILDNFTVAKTWTAKFKSIAKSLLIISASVYICAEAISKLGLLKKKQFDQGITGFIVILGALTIVQVLVSKFAKGAEIGTAATILSFALSLIVIVNALKSLVDLVRDVGDPTVIEAAFNDLASVMVGMLGCVFALALINQRIGAIGTAANALQIISFAIALKILIWALQDLVTLKIDNVWDYLGKLGSVLLAMVVLAGVASLVGPGAGIGIIAVVLALKVLISTLDEIMALDIEKLSEKKHNFMVVFGLLGVLVVLTAAFGEYALQGGIGILAIAIALGLMTGVITQLGNMDPRTATKGLTAIIVLIGGITMLCLITATAGQYAIRAGAAIILIAIALGLLTGVVLLLGSMKPSVAFRGVLAVIPLIVAISVLMMTTKLAGEHALTAAVGIGIIALAIGGLVYTIYILAQINTVDLAKAITAIGSIMLLMSVMMIFSRFTGASSMAGILAMSAAFVLICGALVAISFVPEEQLETAVHVIDHVGAIFAALMFLSQFTDAASVLKIIAIGVAVGVLTAFLAYLATQLRDVNGSQMKTQFEAISELVAAIGATLAVLSVLDVGPIDAAKAGAAFDIFVALIGGLAFVADAIDKKLAGDNLEGILDNGIQILERCGKALGSFLHGIGDGFWNGSGGKAPDTSALDAAPSFGEKVTALVESLVGAAEKLSGKEGALESLKGIGQVVMSFAKADLMEAISMFIGSKSDFAQFAGTLDAIAEGLKQYAEKVEGGNFTDEAIEASIKMAGLLATLYGTDDLRSGGFIGTVLGDSIGLDTFGGQLEQLADGLSKYAEKVVGGTFTGEAIDGSTKLAQLLATLYGSDDLKKGGFIGKVLGDSIGLNQFGEQLVALAKGLADYATEINGATFDQEQIDKSKRLAKMLVALSGSENLVRGGIMAAIAGDVIPLDTFGDQLKKLASGLLNYVNTINGATFDQEQIDKSERLAKMLAALASNDIPTEGGLAGIIFGNKSLSGFSKQLSSVASGIVAYVNKLREAKITQNEVSSSVRLAGIVNTLASIKTPDTLGKISTYSQKLISFAENMKQFLETISGINLDANISGITGLLEQIPALSKAYEDALNSISDATASLDIDLSGPLEEVNKAVDTMKNDVGNGFKEAWATASESVSNASTTITNDVSTMANSITTAVSNSGIMNKWKSAGTDLTFHLAQGIRSGGAVSSVKRAGSYVAGQGANAAESTKNEWKSVGKALADGLANGVSANSGKIRDAARRAAKSAYEAAKRELKSASPSKKFMQLGKWADEGLAIGIEKNSRLPVRNAATMAKKIVSASKNAIDRVCELVNSDMVDDPVIKPVLDLSEIQNGSDRLYSMMSDMNEFSLRGNVELASGTAASVGNERRGRQERDNDILSALIDGLKELKRQNDEPRGNTYVIDGITYDDGSNVANAIGALIRAAKVGGRT